MALVVRWLWRNEETNLQYTNPRNYLYRGMSQCNQFGHKTGQLNGKRINQSGYKNPI